MHRVIRRNITTKVAKINKNICFGTSNQSLIKNNCYRTPCSHFSTSVNPENHPDIKALFKYINDAITPMLDSNPGMSIEIDGPTITVELGRDLGAYTVIASMGAWDKPQIAFMSPISGGIWNYHLVGDHWISMEDRHFLVELWTREMINKCYGYPMF